METFKHIKTTETMLRNTRVCTYPGTHVLPGRVLIKYKCNFAKDVNDNTFFKRVLKLVAVPSVALLIESKLH